MIISSVAEDSEDEDGTEVRSIQDSESIMLAGTQGLYLTVLQGGLLESKSQMGKDQSKSHTF